MDDMNWVWIAGFFEGEGNVQLLKKGTRHTGRATIGQKDKRPLQAINDYLVELGYSTSFYQRPKSWDKRYKKYRDPIWVLALNTRDQVIEFYEEIIPYLFAKKEQAEFVVETLTRERDERDAILKEAIRLRNEFLSWREISWRLGVGRVSILNYAKSAGIELDNKPHFEDVMDWRDDRIRRGLCEKCGKPRGKNGTKRKCRPCADKHNAWRNEHRRKHGRSD